MSDIVGEVMFDNGPQSGIDLRTRIAVALLGDGCQCFSCTAVAVEKADAVIRELERQPPGLQPDGSYITPAGTVWRHNGQEWTDDPDYRP